MDLKSLESLLGGDVFFVPCEWGTKKPLVTYVQRPFEATKSEAYRALFQVQEVNFAVYLGRASGGLCAIDFDVSVFDNCSDRLWSSGLVLLFVLFCLLVFMVF